MMEAEAPAVLDEFREFRRTGDRNIRNRLVEAYLDLARREALRFSGKGEHVDDLIQVARLGILKAVERFEPDLGVPFTAFARPTVAGELRRHFRDTTWTVHVPRSLKDLHSGLGKASAALAGRLGRNPTATELATDVGCSVDVVLEALELRSAYRPASISAPLDAEGSTFDPPATDEPDALDASVDSIVIRDLLSELDQRSRTIVYLRFFGQFSQSEIAERVGISQVHVSRLLRSSIVTLHDRVAQMADHDDEAATDEPTTNKQGTT